ncbi:MAG: hypothetical protein AB7Q97_05535 [Gammaproteobacteria bacterium]
MHDSDASYALAGHLKRLLLAALVAPAVWMLAGLAQFALETIDQSGWMRHPATITSTAFGNLVEIEIDGAIAAAIPGHAEPEAQTPRERDHRLILVPRTAGAWHRHGTRITLLQDPHNPARVRVQSHPATAIVTASYTIGILVLGFVARRLLRAPWGRDVIWRDGRWLPAAGNPVPGARANGTGVRRYPPSTARWGWFWPACSGLGTFAVGMWAPWREDPAARITGIALLVFTVLALLSWLQWLTRRVHYDAVGVADISFFGARRMAWRDVGSYARVDIHKQARRRTRLAERRDSIHMHRFSDLRGHPVLELSDDLGNEMQIGEFIESTATDRAANLARIQVLA